MITALEGRLARNQHDVARFLGTGGGEKNLSRSGSETAFGAVPHHGAPDFSSRRQPYPQVVVRSAVAEDLQNDSVAHETSSFTRRQQELAAFAHSVRFWDHR